MQPEVSSALRHMVPADLRNRTTWPSGMHAAHEVNGPPVPHAILATAELLALLLASIDA